MDLKENYTYLNNIKSWNIDCSKIVFYTKKELDDVLSMDWDILKIFELLSELYHNTSNFEAFEEIIIESKLVSIESKYSILQFMIEKWISYAPLFVFKFNLNLEEMHKNVFIQWIELWDYELIYSEYFSDYIQLYSNPNDLLEEMLQKWYIEAYNYYFEINDTCLEKRDDILMQKVLNEFEIRFLKIWLTKKINLLSMYNWEKISDILFESNVIAYDRIIEICKLWLDDKEGLQELKNKELYIEYNKNIDDEKEIINLGNFSIITVLDFSTTNKNDNNLNPLHDELIKIWILKNWWNAFEVTFIDIIWNTHTFTLWDDKINWTEDINSYKDLQEFISDIKEINSKYNNWLNINDFDYTIIISKSNWKNDSNDNQIINNIKFSWKELKIA